MFIGTIWLQKIRLTQQSIMKIREEIIASFNVENEIKELKQVIVVQEIRSLYSKEETYTKKFRLESLGGAAVYKTENPSIFQLANGTLLKRKKP